MAAFSITAFFKAKDDLSAVVKGIQKNNEKLSASMKPLSQRVTAGFKSMGDSAKKLGEGIKTIGTALAAAGAVAGVGLAAAAKPGVDFEEAIAAVGAVSLETRAQVADLEKKARELGRTTKFSATEVAGGMELMAKAGFDHAQILAGIGPILSAAAAEGAEFEEVAGLVSNTMKGMGLSMDQTGRVADVLTLASARTNSSIASLGESMSNVSSTARQFKIPFEDAVASVALLQDVGLDASVAGSALNTMLTNMANPSKDVAAQMKTLGITFQDAKGDMLPLAQVFEQFAKGAKKSGGNMKQVAFFADLVGLRGQKAAMNLQQLFKEGKFTALAEELRHAAGSAEKMATLRMDTFKGDLKLLVNQAMDLGIDLYDLVKGPLRSIVQAVKTWMDANKGIGIERLKSALAAAMPLIERFGAALAAGFSEAWPAIQGVLATLFSGFSGKQGWMQGIVELATVLGKVAAAAIGVGVVFGGMVIAGIQLAAREVNNLIGIWSGLISGIGAAVFAVDNFIANFNARLDRLRADIGAFWESLDLVGAGQKIVMMLVEGIEAMASKPVEAIKSIARKIRDLLPFSPAKAGPLRDLGRVRIVETIASTVKSKPLVEAMTRTVRLAMAPVLVPPGINARSLGSDYAPVWPRQNMTPRQGDSPSESDGGFGQSNSFEPRPQVLSPQERIARQITETTTTEKNQSEVTLKLPAGVTGEVTKQPRDGKGAKIRVSPSGGM